MELIFLFGVLFTIFTISLYYLSTFKTSINSQLPPGKTGWPLIGESVEFLSNLQNVNLENFTFKRMVKYSPDVFKTSILGDHVAVFCGAAGTKFMFTKANKLVKRWATRPVRRIMGTNDLLDESFDRYIKPELLRFVKFDGLRNIVGVMDSMAQHHLETHWHEAQVITVYPSVKKYAFALACRSFLSIEDPAILESLFDPIEMLMLGLQSMPIDLPGTRMNRSVKIGAILKSQIEQIIKHQRTMKSFPSSDENNVLPYLLEACKDNKHVAHGVLVLLIAGHETVTSVVCLMLKVMADNPDVYRRVHEENMNIREPGEPLTVEDTHKLRYTWNVALEVMRLYSPAPFITREAMTDFKYGNYHIPKGYKLITDIHAIHKDPKYYPEPLKFDPSRFDGDGPLPYTYIPFGGGPNMCPGKNYAQLVILVFIHNVVKRFKWKTVIADEKITGIPLPKPSQGLPIILYPH